MKKIIMVFVLIIVVKNTRAQVTSVGSDTLQWLQTNIAQRSAAYFAGKPFKTLLDSLYQLKAEIVEFDPPRQISIMCGGTKANGSSPTNIPSYVLVNYLTFYFGAISDGGLIDQIQTTLNENNLRYNQHNVINTHVKYFKVVFQQPIQYPLRVANSENGTWLWKPFAEYFWGPKIIQSVSVGEY